MWSTKGSSAWPTSLSLANKTIWLNAPNILELHLFADDKNLFPNNTNILNLETNLNGELQKVRL